MTTQAMQDELKKIVPVEAMVSIIEMADKRTKFELSDDEIKAYVISEFKQQSYIAKNWLRTLIVRGEITI